MALPKMMIRLFPPKQAATSFSASGSLVLPLDEVHALAEWLLSQAGEYDSYLGTNVIRLLGACRTLRCHQEALTELL